jgi:pantothenate kinase-related protein Tda10
MHAWNNLHDGMGPGADCADVPEPLDIDGFDAAFFDRVRDRVVRAGERGIYVDVMFFEGWALHLSPSPDTSRAIPSTRSTT